MRVLSLFDGMSCGQIALNRAGIAYTDYYASEIDKYAIKVAQANYPNTIQLGDIHNIKGSDLSPIDLLIGGSPCQGFSFAGKQLNFEDERSKLFFEYVRLLNELKPRYFLLENVQMKKESKDIITSYMGVEPVMINSALVSAQNRKRLYWTNIPIEPLEDKGILLKDIIDKGLSLNQYILSDEWQEWYKTRSTDKRYSFGSSIKIENLEDKCSTLLVMNGGNNRKLVYDDMLRKLTPPECERLQTVPENYTAHVSNSQRYKMLGNGWTVDVIAHIFKGLV